MAEIPEDVVERAKRAFYGARGFDDSILAALRVEWEREQCARYMETTLPHLSLKEYADDIRRRK